MPTVKNADIEPLVGALRDLAAKELSVKLALKVRRVAKIVDAQATIYYDVRQAKMKEFARKKPDDSIVTEVVDDKEIVVWENEQAWLDALKELNEETFEVAETIGVTELEAANITIKPTTLFGLGVLLEGAE